jgi:hypothetical protein
MGVHEVKRANEAFHNTLAHAISQLRGFAEKRGMGEAITSAERKLVLLAWNLATADWDRVQKAVEAELALARKVLKVGDELDAFVKAAAALAASSLDRAAARMSEATR